MQALACTDPKRNILPGQSNSVHAQTTQVDFEDDRPPPVDSPPGDILITMVQETVIIYKKEFRKMKTGETFSHLSLI